MKTLTSLMKNADFPSKFRVLIHSNHDDLIKWAIEQGFEVWEGFKKPIVEARHWLLDGVETDYALLNYCDWEPTTSFMPLLNAMETDLSLASISPLLKTRERVRRGKLLKINEGEVMRHILTESEVAKISSSKSFYYVDFTTNSSILIRMKAYRQHPYDTDYGMSGHHIDWFMQLYYTDWRSAVHRHVCVRRLPSKKPEGYSKMRASTVRSDRQRFKEKWGKKLA